MTDYFEHYLEQLKKRFKEEFNIDIEDKWVDADLADVLMYRANCLIPYVARKMGKRNDELKKCLTKLILIESPVLNGYVKTKDNWKTFQIHVSWGLMIFIHKMIKLFLCRMSVTNGHCIVDEARISDEEMLSAAERLMQAFWRGTFFQTPSISLTDLSKSQIELSTYLLHYAECFVIAHEFGHVLIETCPEKIRKELLTASAAIESRNKGIKISQTKHVGVGEKTLLESWTKELTADLLGLKLCLEQRDDDIGRMVIRSSAELVFIFMLMLEKFYEKSTGQNYWLHERDRGMTHPPTVLRLEFLSLFVDPLYPSYSSVLGGVFRQLGDYILSKI